LDLSVHRTALTDPGRTANSATFVIAKRRVQALTTLGKYGMEGWFRWTSNNWNTNTFTVFSVYNRDGINIYIGRLWVDGTVDPVSLKTLQSGGSYSQIGTYNTTPAQGTYNPGGYLFDRAGSWQYVKLVVDFTAKTYGSAQFNESIFPLSNALDSTADAGARQLHFSVECAQKTSTRRFMNVASLVGTIE